ncbi:unnamed protein product [Aspergillus oryzae RIB40]|uniref:DNA, SC113 n=2 Tax=Aspergillus oryzae TaxID=5062 RepID=Q2U6A0_ASPOR|nr:unnamed protein product [Aspergillus oryzae RIB40]EIT83152.1 hypothetical protein Ao3042_11610 [Aspergillus oryzae 3.042]KDE83181.1 hypothetical protein AO1008_09734 [Aspergillus oryzae 100-8]BAE62915.1 unnamed protein product [Aspergillus oryzae RIB40]|eukprot:EIT83152.1 hypothetical protein Ao3042_11610 [Aspergillus oryzae 3.042]
MYREMFRSKPGGDLLRRLRSKSCRALANALESIVRMGSIPPNLVLYGTNFGWLFGFNIGMGTRAEIMSVDISGSSGSVCDCSNHILTDRLMASILLGKTNSMTL